MAVHIIKSSVKGVQIRPKSSSIQTGSKNIGQTRHTGNMNSGHKKG